MKRPAFRYYITYGVTTQEVFPYDTPKCKITDKQETDQIFFRKKFTGKLVFRNDPKLGITDFDFFKTIELNGNSCTPIQIDVREYCDTGGTYGSIWIGQFSTGSGSFDMNACRFEVTPDVLDKYSCLLSKWEQEINIFDYLYALQLAEKSTGVTYQSVVSTNVGAAARCGGFIRCSIAATTKAWYTGYTSAADMMAKGWCVKSHTTKTESTYKKILVMYDKTLVSYDPFAIGDVIESVGFGNSATICDMYEGTHGDASGCSPCDCSFGHDCEWWWLIIRNVTDPGNDFNSCNNLLGIVGGGTKNGVSCKASTESYCSVTTVWESQLVQIACVSGSCVPTPGGYFLVSTDCGTTGFCTFRRCPINVTGTKFHGVLMNELVNDIAHGLCPDIDMMSSIFFEYNPNVSDSHYITGINYITGAGNKLMDLILSQKSDVMNPNASNPATIGMVTLKKLLDWFREVFEVFWDVVDIGGNTVLQLEHFNFFSSQPSTIDLSATSPYIEYILAKEKYEHLKLTIPQRETYEFVDSGGEDFIGKAIEYNSLCAQEENAENHAPEELSTDVDYILNFPNLQPEGFVMMATDFISGIYQLNFEPGLLTGISFTNAHLSWANLHYNYHRYNRYLSSGNMNGNPTSFFSWKPNIKQAVLEFPLCCQAIIPTNYFVTVLSGIVNANGYVESVEKSLHNGMVKLILKYSI